MQDNNNQFNEFNEIDTNDSKSSGSKGKIQLENSLQPQELEQITLEIRKFLQVERSTVMRIGKRLCFVKEKLSHGEFGKWITENFDMSHKTANRYMQIFRQFRNVSAAKNLNLAQCAELRSLPKTLDLQAFIEQSHEIPSSGETKKVEAMTSREVREIVKDQRKKAGIYKTKNNRMGKSLVSTNPNDPTDNVQKEELNRDIDADNSVRNKEEFLQLVHQALSNLTTTYIHQLQTNVLEFKNAILIGNSLTEFQQNQLYQISLSRELESYLYDKYVRVLSFGIPTWAFEDIIDVYEIRERVDRILFANTTPFDAFFENFEQNVLSGNLPTDEYQLSRALSTYKQKAYELEIIVDSDDSDDD